MEANTHTPATTAWLIFRIGQVSCAVPTLSVETLLPPPAHLTAAPGADAGRPGLFHHGTETIAVVDLRHRFGIEAPDRGRGRLLLTRVGGRGYGLWVDEVVGLADSGQVKPAPLPPELPHNLFTQALLHRGEIVLCSDPARLLAMRDAGRLPHLAQPPAAADATPETPATTPPEPPSTPPVATPPPLRQPPATAPPRPAPRPPPPPAVPKPAPTPPPRPPHGETPPPPPAAAAPGNGIAAPPPSPRPIAPPPEPVAAPPPPPGSDGRRRALLLLLLALLAGGSWFAADRWLAVPPAVPHPAAAPTPTLIASGRGVQVERTGHEVTLVIDRAKALGTPHAATPPAPASAAPRPAPPKPRVYIHTVVKGDTLWAIARHYLNDPWRYSELARLSHIKDPDLIYPGDRVRIVIR